MTKLVFYTHGMGLMTVFVYCVKLMQDLIHDYQKM